MAPDARRLATLLAMLVFTDTFGYAIVLPLLPLAAQRRGAGPLAVGALFATYSGLQLVFAPVLGRLSDRFGRKPVLLASVAGSIAGFALMLLPGYLPVFLSRVVDGATAGNISVANAVVLDRFPRDDWGRRFTVLASVTGLGIVAGVTVSAGLARFGLAAAALTAMALSTLLGVLIWFFLPETSPRQQATWPWRLPSLDLRSAIPSGLAATAVQAAFLLTLPLFLFRTLGWRETQSTSAIAALIGVAAVFQIAVVSPAMRRLDPRDAARLGFLFIVAGGVALAVARSPIAILAGAVVAIVGVALVTPAVPTLIGLHNPGLKQGEVMGVNQSVASAGQMVGPLLGYGALLLSPAGYGAICAGLAACGIALTLPIRGHER